jgi:hypothetical protein
MKQKDKAQKNPVITVWTLKAFFPNRWLNLCPFNCRIKINDSTDTARKIDARVKTNKTEFKVFSLEYIA